jgi:hypothetical protein
MSVGDFHSRFVSEVSRRAIMPCTHLPHYCMMQVIYLRSLVSAQISTFRVFLHFSYLDCRGRDLALSAGHVLSSMLRVSLRARSFIHIESFHSSSWPT